MKLEERIGTKNTGYIILFHNQMMLDKRIGGINDEYGPAK